MISVAIRKSIRFLFAFILLATLQSCTLFRSSDKSLDEQSYMKYTELFHQAGIQRMLGNDGAAHELYLKAAEINPNSAAAHYFSALLFYHKEAYQRALFHINKSLDIDSEHLWYNFLAASVHQKLGNYKDSRKYYRYLTDRHPQADFIYKDLIDLYLQYNKKEEATEVFKLYAQHAGADKDYALRIYRELSEQPDLALNFVEYLRTIFADTLRFDMLTAEQLLNRGDTKAAEEIYMHYFNKEKPDTRVLVTLYNYYYYTDKANIVKELEQRIIQSDATPEIKLQIAHVQAAEDSSAYIETILMLHKQYPDHPEVNLPVGNYYYEQDNFKNAFAAFRVAYRTHKSNFLLNRRLLHSADIISDYQNLKAYADTAMSYLPNRPEVYLYSGKASVYLGQKEIAKTYLETGRSLVFDNDSILQKFDYCDALYDYSNGEYSKAREEFKRLSNQVSYSAKPNVIYWLSDAKLNSEQSKALNRLELLKTLLPKDFYCRAYAIALYYTKSSHEALDFLESCTFESDLYTEQLKKLISENSSDALLP
jgi:tetratricopeptide (TPR) repeat protein